MKPTTALRATLATLLLLAATAVTAAARPALTWHDTAPWKPGGRAWDDTPTPFSRLPRRAEGEVTKAVWKLSLNSAGLVFYFRTDAPEIHTRHTVAGELAKPHMNATATSGLDLYARDQTGAWHWAGSSRPNSKTHEQAVLSGAEPALRDYMLYLPLYNTVESLEIGVPAGCAFEPVAPPSEKPVVYYGTSIAQGCAASRPGLTTPAMLGRKLGLPVINLGFSGNGKMEPAMAGLVAEIDAAVFVLDCLPNMSALSAPEIIGRTENCIRVIRKTHPATPIILMEDRTYGHAWLVPKLRQKHADARAALRSVHEKLAAGGVTGVTYIPGAQLLGDDDTTVDGSHPGDLGLFRQAEILLPVLKQVLKN
ncbi:SGNH/GDSL hydrolase family protein [Termitidicoccus mucosus]